MIFRNKVHQSTGSFVTDWQAPLQRHWIHSLTQAIQPSLLAMISIYNGTEGSTPLSDPINPKIIPIPE